MFVTAARFVDLFAMAFVFGATVWFFFVQSPLLLARMGRDSFVPLQMRLTAALFQALAVALLVMTAASVAHGRRADLATLGAGVALAGGLINRFLIVPRALRAGGQSRRDIAGKDHEGSTAGFASEGAGAKTKVLHRLVVLFVLVMLAGAVTHGFALIEGTP